MITDFIYYLREYGFKFVWEERKSIFFNNDYALMFAEAVFNYGNTLDGVVLEIIDLEDLGYEI